jgi:predicted phage terminase large subunit-like protein
MAGFKLTTDQSRAMDLQASDATHVMLYGGSRSGKTFVHLRTILVRALAHKSRHAVLRFRFNHVKQSVIYDTLPKVMELCWPDVIPHCKLDKQDWFYQLPNGSEIWFGGLDDKERTEKILGQEYASVFLNECSQISWSSRNMVVTRLAQKTPLRLKMFYDCNPPASAHWTYQVFVTGKSPDTRRHLPNPENFGAMLMNPDGNRVNLPEEYLKELQNLPEKQRLRFWLGQFQSDEDGALWTIESIDQCRLDGELPDMQRVVVAVDPSGCSGEEDERSDEVGIVVCGLGTDGLGYVLEDLSGRYGPGKWAKIVTDAFERHEADRVVAETNYGGAMVGELIRTARPGTPFQEVKASRGKVVRAEPVSNLFETGKVKLAGSFPDMEDQMCGMNVAGYTGSKSPDRADAMIWGIHSLFPALTKKEKPEHFTRPARALTSQDKMKQRLRGKR